MPHDCTAQTGAATLSGNAVPATRPVKYLSIETESGAIDDSIRGLDILKRDLPIVANNPQILQVRNLVLLDPQKYMPGFTDENADEINKNLTGIEVPANYGAPLA